MSEMVERGARAAYEAYKARYAIVDMPSWEDTPYDKSAFLDYSRAVIESMREPTEAMGAAGLMASSHDPLGGNEKMTSEEAEKIGWTDRLRANPLRWEMPIWRAMIDEALK